MRHVLVSHTTESPGGPYWVELLGSPITHSVSNISRAERAIDIARDISRIHNVSEIRYEPADHFAPFLVPKSIDQLGQEYAGWLKSHGLNTDAPAREVLMTRWDDLTWVQRQWLGEFIRQWEAATGVVPK